MKIFYREDLNTNYERPIIEIPKPSNDHCHFRFDDRSEIAVPAEMQVFGVSLPMPNDGPLDKPDILGRFKEYILSITGTSTLKCLWTFFLSVVTTPLMVREFKAAGAMAAKVYMKGATTSSEDGIEDLLDPKLDPVLSEIEKQRMVLCVHPECCGVSILRREAAFIPVIDELIRRYPLLKISIEHITTKEMVQAVLFWPSNVTSTITVHHLFLTLDDVIGELNGKTKIRPHHYCLPVAKEPEHILALRRAAFSGHEKFRLGTDSAPHKIHTKECAEGCAGLYTTPVTMPLLIELFLRHSRLENLIRFTSTNSQLFWGYEPTQEVSIYIPEAWEVPLLDNEIMIFLGGERLPYQLNKKGA